MTEIARLRQRAKRCGVSLTSTPAADRYWATASWHSRADILRTAEWLVGIGSKGACDGDASEPVYFPPLAIERAMSSG